MKKVLVIAISSFSALCGCERFDLTGLFASASPDVDKRFGQYMDYNEAHPRSEYPASADAYTFYLCADPHIDGSAANAQSYVSTCLADPAAEMFSVCLGDMTSRKGRQDVAANAFRPLSENGRIFHCTAGNHDLYFGEWDKYFSLNGSSSYCFVVTTPSGGKDFYLFLDSASGTMGSLQLSWLKERLKEASQLSYRHIIVFTHTNLFDEDLTQGISGNYPAEELYELLDSFSSAGVDCVITGHDHKYGSVEFKGVKYITLNAFVETKPVGGYYSVTVSDRLTLNYIEQKR